jgi:hypothetical protein
MVDALGPDVISTDDNLVVTMSPTHERRYVYRVDASDSIQFLSPEWLAFARENGAPHLDEASLLGRPIWQFIAGDEVKELYAVMFGKVRSKKGPIRIPFRCDSPGLRRFMDLEMLTLPGDGVELTGRLIRKEVRDPVSLLDSSARRARHQLRLCSWCKRILESEKAWIEVEEAVRRMDLLGARELPDIKHTICPACKGMVEKKISDRELT